MANSVGLFHGKHLHFRSRFITFLSLSSISYLLIHSFLRVVLSCIVTDSSILTSYCAFCFCWGVGHSFTFVYHSWLLLSPQ